MQPEHEHFDRFAEFIKIKVDTPQLVGIAEEDRQKAIFPPPLEAITVEELNQFITGLEDGTLAKLALEEDPEGGDQAHDHDH